MSASPQPTEEQESANAAYVWRKQCQANLVERLSNREIKLEDAQWYWVRFLNAYEREIALTEKAKAVK